MWNYEKTMLIKIVAMFRNLLISSFDATIRVKRAFHPAPASRGFASHIFLVCIVFSPHATVVDQNWLHVVNDGNCPSLKCFSLPTRANLFDTQFTICLSSKDAMNLSNIC